MDQTHKKILLTLGSMYYMGWQSSLENVSEKSTKFFIHTKFNITDFAKGDVVNFYNKVQS